MIVQYCRSNGRDRIIANKIYKFVDKLNLTIYAYATLASYSGRRGHRVVSPSSARAHTHAHTHTRPCASAPPTRHYVVPLPCTHRFLIAAGRQAPWTQCCHPSTPNSFPLPPRRCWCTVRHGDADGRITGDSGRRCQRGMHGRRLPDRPCAPDGW